MRRTVLLLDGTWNTPTDNTNIYRLNDLVADVGDDGVEQIVEYDEGVGTGRFDRLRGGAFGLGLSKSVRKWYRWVSDNHAPGDELFIFGFSRGAYTARSLAGMIAQCGLMPPEPDESVDDVWELYRKDGRGLGGERRHIDIEFIGVFDTVGALGVPMGPIRSKFTRKGTLFHRTTPSVRYKAMYQALAMDENRKAYRATLWTRYAHADEPPDPLRDDQTAEQRWFVGAHSNVGGGYPDNPLADTTLKWMMDRANDHGLTFKPGLEVKGDEHSGKRTDSFKKFMLGLYRLARFGRRHWRPVGAPARQVINRKTTQRGRSFPINESIDASVLLRYNEDPDYRPESLEKWAQRNSVDLSAATGDQRVGTWL